MAAALPLPPNYFDTNTRLSDDVRRQYIEFAESSIRKVFALSDSHKNSWVPVHEKKGVAVYRNCTQSRGTAAHTCNIAEVGCKSQFHASLEEIGRAYAAHDDTLFRRLTKKLIPGVMDAAVLRTIVPRTPYTPFRYIGLKWFAVKTPTPLVSHRDYCCLEVQDKIVDTFGNEMYIRVLNSVEAKECPSLENSHGLVRANLMVGYMYRVDRAEPSLVRIHHVARFDPCGYFPSQWAFKSAESQLVSSIRQIRRIIEKQHLNACTFVDKKQWVPNEERQSCAVCDRAFSTFRPRHHCRCCGEVICGKCSVQKEVEIPGTNVKKVRMCSICNMGVQKSAPADDGDNMSDASASSITSNSTVGQNEMGMVDMYYNSNGNPDTPSAYSSASAQSNLSMQSSASTRSVAGRHSRSSFAQSRSSSRRNIFGFSHTPRMAHHSSQRDVLSEAVATPRRTLFRRHWTPRSSADKLDASTSFDEKKTDVVTQERMSMFREKPLDLGYLEKDKLRSESSHVSQVEATEVENKENTTSNSPADPEAEVVTRKSRRESSTGGRQSFLGGLFNFRWGADE